MTTKVITSHVYPPIPLRTFDWCAYLDGQEEAGPYGWGRTEAEAIADLRQNLGEICLHCGRDDHPVSCSTGGCPVGADL